jgi:uncharacterized protein (TIGR00730 family)
VDLKSVCVYCGSSPNTDAGVETEIRAFGREIARRGIRLIYGGASRGLMGAIADEVIHSGGMVTGIIPKALEGRESAHQGLSELRVVGSMHEREQLMFDLSDAFVAFPGGFGTMEEIIEMITWKQMGIHGKPIVIANIGGYFNPLLQQFELAVQRKYARNEDRILFAVADTTKAILTFLEGAPVLSRKAGDWA